MVCLKPTQPHFIIIEFNCQVYSYKMSPVGVSAFFFMVEVNMFSFAYVTKTDPFTAWLTARSTWAVFVSGNVEMASDI